MLEVHLDTRIQNFHLDLSISAEIGKTTVLLGESGAGKSMLLRHIAGLLHPQAGYIALGETIYFDSAQRIALPPQERPFGYVFQDYALFPHLTVFENVAFGLRAQHLPQKQIRLYVGEALAQVHLEGLDRRLPAQLSGGQQQRVALARALALRPKLLLLDEPLSALDVQTRREVRQHLRSLLSDITITTLLVTHQYLDALLFGHKIVVIDHGHIIQQGHHSALLRRPRSSYIAELVGTNFFHGRLIHYDTSMLCTIECALPQSKPLIVQATFAEQEHPYNELEGEEEAYVVVDPRSITLSHSSPEGSARNIFRGEITHVLQLDSSYENRSFADGRVRVSILLDASPLPLTAELTSVSAAQMDLREGQKIYAAFKATEARAYI